jgi:ribosomal protein L37AE/L43A
MAEVTCPQCGTRQSIDPDAEAYRCVECAATWSFVRCTVCGERYHTRPGVRAWTCPNCGTPHGRNRRGISSAGISIPLILGALLAVGAVVAVAQALGGDDADGRATPVSPSASAEPLRRVCRHLVDVQLLRVDALGRTITALTEDAADLRMEGKEEQAKAVDEIIEAIRTYQEVAEGGGDNVAATNRLLDALAAVECPG